jgi:uncharacterized repeat protein (TIGR03803 family)
VTPGGDFTTIFSFDLGNGYVPFGVIVRGADGYFYGATESGGSGACGTIFRFDSAGAVSSLHDFSLSDGCYPEGLAQDTDGVFYGAAEAGGAYSRGTFFSLSVGLGPLVETVPASGKIGAAVQVLGTALTGATSVTFNGTAATFTVASDTLITPSVPTGATTGLARVVTPHGTLSSNVRFQVLP